MRFSVTLEPAIKSIQSTHAEFLSCQTLLVPVTHILSPIELFLSTKTSLVNNDSIFIK